MGIFTPIQHRRWLTYALIAVDTLLFIGLLVFLYVNFWQKPTQSALTAAHPVSETSLILPQLTANTTPQQSITTAPTHPTATTFTTTVGQHGNLSQVFSDHHLSHRELAKLMQLELAQEYLMVIQPKQKLTITVDNAQQLQKLTLALSGDRQLIVERQSDALQARLALPHYSTALDFVQGHIHHSLSQSAHLAGMDAKLTSELTHIFEQQIDFAKTLRRGDHFDLLYQAKYHDGIKVSNGPIVAAEFSNRGHTYRAYRYQLSGGQYRYYTENGRSLKRLFLKAPVHYSRISSYFSYHRMDPILHRVQPHLGVDYAAPIGTPIYSVSDGEVVFKGRRGGYGNAIVVQYGPHIRSLYGHLSKYAKHLHRGQHVSQGQTIGYVGATGWATGPHLHYGLYINGVPRNPLTYKLPKGSGLSHHLMPDFKRRSNALQAQLNLHQGPYLSTGNTSASA